METQSVEYKQIWRDDFLKEICGFANAQGGTLYIGIADNGEVVGVENPDIAATFFRAGEVEAWGQGIERVQTYCTDYGCPVPEWRFDGAGIWTVFYYKTQTESSEKSSGKGEQKGREKSTLKTREKTRGKN